MKNYMKSMKVQNCKWFSRVEGESRVRKGKEESSRFLGGK